MMAVITDVCQNYSNFSWGYLQIRMVVPSTDLNGQHSSFLIYSKPKSSDAASVQVAWNITEVCCPMLCICQMAFKTSLPWVSRWPWPNTLKVLLQGMRGVLGFRAGISCSSGNGSLSSEQSIWKAHSVITPCSPVTQHRGEDKQKGSCGGASRRREAEYRGGHWMASALVNRWSDCQGLWSNHAHMHTPSPTHLNSKANMFSQFALHISSLTMDLHSPLLIPQSEMCGNRKASMSFLWGFTQQLKKEKEDVQLLYKDVGINRLFLTDDIQV